MDLNLRSMTGYGQSSDSSHGLICITLTSVNYRSLHIECKLPPTLAYVEEMVRKKIKEKIERGRLCLHINWSERPQGEVELVINEDLLEKLQPLFKREDLPKEIWSGAATEMGLIQTKPIAVDQKALSFAIEKALDKALLELVASKEREGKALKTDLIKRFDLLGVLAKSIDIKQEKQRLYETKRERLSELSIEEDRINTEIALLIDKADVSEELVRIQAHLKTVKKTLSSPCISKGKKLDFLSQELGREASTLSSKVTLEASKEAAIEMRHEIEKIREQLANVE